MRFNIGRCLLLAFFSSSFILASGMAYSAKVEIRIGHVEAPGQPIDVVLNNVAKRIEESSNGNISFRVFPGAQLGGARDMTEAVQMGFQQATVIPAAFLGGFNPLTAVLDIPYVLPADDMKARELLASEFGKEVLSSFGDYGMKAVGFWPGGRKSFSMNGELNSLADFAGKRFRIMDSKVLMAEVSALGANPVSMPFSDVYMGLQTGGVDGQENPLDSIVRMKFHEVQDSVLLTEHGVVENIVLFNEAFWDGLSQEDKEIVSAAFSEGVSELTALKKEAGEKALITLKEAGVKVNSPDEAMKVELKDKLFSAGYAEFIGMTGSKGEKLMEKYFSFVGENNQ